MIHQPTTIFWSISYTCICLARCIEAGSADSHLIKGCIHTEILHQGCDEGPWKSRLCFCFYLTHWTSRAAVLPRHGVIRNSEPAIWIQIFGCVVTKQSTSAWRLLFQQCLPFLKTIKSYLTSPSPQFTTISLYTPVTCSWWLRVSRCLFYRGLNTLLQQI